MTGYGLSFLSCGEHAPDGGEERHYNYAGCDPESAVSDFIRHECICKTEEVEKCPRESEFSETPVPAVYEQLSEKGNDEGDR